MSLRGLSAAIGASGKIALADDVGKLLPLSGHSKATLLPVSPWMLLDDCLSMQQMLPVKPWHGNCIFWS
jgi:hypothetical protein